MARHSCNDEPGVLVVTHLQVPSEHYESMLPVYREVVASIRPLAAGVD